MAKIVQKLSSIVAQTGRVFGRRKITMNETSAKRLQRMIFEARTAKKDGNCTPAYKNIAEQMNSQHEQIFCAAVYNLVKIANNSIKYKDDILGLLQEYASAEKVLPTRREYVLKKIAEIK